MKQINDQDTTMNEAIELARQRPALDEAIDKLTLHSHDELCQARDALACRLLHHPDDYTATAALQMLYRAIATKGWPFEFDWRKEVRPPKRHRRYQHHRGRHYGQRFDRPCPGTAAAPPGIAASHLDHEFRLDNWHGNRRDRT